MNDLREMIDETTKRLLRKIDNWEVPQSDKKYVTVEKEVYESVLRVNCSKIAECEQLQKQLDIAVKRLKFLKTKTSSPYYGNGTYLKTIYQMCDKTLRQIEELNK